MLLAKVLPFANYAKQLGKKLLKSKSFLNPSKKSKAPLLAATMLGLRSKKAPWNSLSTQKKNNKSPSTSGCAAQVERSHPREGVERSGGRTPHLSFHAGEPRVGSSAWWAQLTALARAVREQEHSQKGVQQSGAVLLSGTKPYSKGGVRGGGHFVSRLATKDSLFIAKLLPSSSLPWLG